MTYLGEEAVSMAKLTHLFLDHMSLQELSNTAVSKCPGLVHLDISYNQLRVIQPFSEGSPKLARLNLAGNPIYCNCYLQPLRYRRPKTKVLINASGEIQFTSSHFYGPSRQGMVDSPQSEADGDVWGAAPHVGGEPGSHLPSRIALSEPGSHAEGRAGGGIQDGATTNRRAREQNEVSSKLRL